MTTKKPHMPLPELLEIVIDDAKCGYVEYGYQPISTVWYIAGDGECFSSLKVTPKDHAQEVDVDGHVNLAALSQEVLDCINALEYVREADWQNAGEFIGLNKDQIEQLHNKLKHITFPHNNKKRTEDEDKEYIRSLKAAQPIVIAAWLEITGNETTKK